MADLLPITRIPAAGLPTSALVCGDPKRAERIAQQLDGATLVGLIDGDALCLSIAAASIVAKVTRDRVMIECHEADPRFGFSAHKGYCTEDHLAALARHGPCHLHRRSFAPVGRLCKGSER